MRRPAIICGLALFLAAVAMFSCECDKDKPSKPEADPQLAVDPPILDFGTIRYPGGSGEKTIRIQNVGGGTLKGQVEIESHSFSVLSGGGPFALGANQVREVKVRFLPPTPGPDSCTIAIGVVEGTPAEVPCNGTASPPDGYCQIAPTDLAFGLVPLGSVATLEFSVVNVGSGSISGRAVETSSEFSIEDDPGFSLAPGEGKRFRVTFEPQTCGIKSCSISFGTASPDRVICTGNTGGSQCTVSATDLDFGTTSPGMTASRSFVIGNTGCIPVQGTVTSSNPLFPVTSGQTFTLSHGETDTVVVRFEPASCGESSSDLTIGPSCARIVHCEGRCAGGACTFDPPALDFGGLSPGQAIERTLILINSGCTPLSGSLSLSGEGYTILPSPGFDLAAGGSQSFQICFHPTGCGSREATITAGDSCPVEVPCKGVAEGAGCAVSPTTLAFDNTRAGQTRRDRVTITNWGCEDLLGSATLNSEDYAIVEGAEYRISPGMSHSIEVEFHPQSCGLKTSTIELPGPCPREIGCTGSASGTECTLEPTSVDFGITSIGAPLVRTLRITNTGCLRIVGTVSETSPDFSLLNATYSLGAGESQNVNVRFDPRTPGSKNCTLDTGTESCGDILCSGRAECPPACSLEPPSLDFGEVPIGGHEDRTFRLRNECGGTLSGSVDETCSAFTIVSGGGAYNLGTGQWLDVSIRFAPTSLGNQACRIQLGNASCPELLGNGKGVEGVPICSVDTPTLEFGTLHVGESATRSFTLSNTGGGIFTGSVGETSDDLRIIQGQGSYALGTGESRQVSVRLEPAHVGQFTCTIETGTEICADVACEANIIDADPLCEITPSSLAFGSVLVGESRDMAFAITNTGGGTLACTVPSFQSESFSIVEGTGAFALGHGEVRTVKVRFEPPAEGLRSFSFDFGACACARISGNGTGVQGQPICSLPEGSIDFGVVSLGGGDTRQFVIENSGNAALSGAVSANCPDFIITSGEGPFVIQPDGTKEVSVLFAPTAVGLRTCVVHLGTDACADVVCAGTGEPAPACHVAPAELEFGTVTIGESSDLGFLLRNDGGGTFTGEISASSPDFSVSSGEGSFSLDAGESQSVTIRFSPQSPGPKTCTIDTGTQECIDVSCTGTGQTPSHCDLSPSTLSFGLVPLGGSAELQFTIRNDGGGTLSGNVSEPCDDFSIPDGEGIFNLSAGESKTITVRFTPTSSGSKECSIGLGLPDGTMMACSGTGDLPPACGIVPSSLDFGTVSVNGSRTLEFRITNTGGGTLSGQATEMCAEFAIASGGEPFALAVGESKTVAVQFAPSSGGDKSCAVLTGIGGCSVGCTGHGDPLPACSVSPASLNFGNVQRNTTASQSFTISNVGGGTLTGAIGEQCDPYSIRSGGGAYSLTAGQSRQVTVDFTPTSDGQKTCTIETGQSGCAVSCTGNGTPPPHCVVSPSNLSFGSVLCGGSAYQSFTITNDGGGTLTGSVNGGNSDFAITGGAGSYSLSGGALKTITVRFAPQSVGEKGCTIDTGVPCSPDVTCSGTGYFDLHSSFDIDQDIDGWSSAGDGLAVTYTPNGNPTGAIKINDGGDGEPFYFRSPDRYDGNLSQAYGGTLSFDLKVSVTGTNWGEWADISVYGGASRITCKFPRPTTVGWEHKSVNLAYGTGTEWHVGQWNDGVVAIAADIQAVLGNVTEIRIRAEWSSSSESGWLDNVRVYRASQ
jgi:hypothetical protein